MSKEKIFVYCADSKYSGEFKKGDRCKILGFTYQDCGPVAWTLNLETGNVRGTNPSNLKIEQMRDKEDNQNG